jgi:hypothetical protein
LAVYYCFDAIGFESKKRRAADTAPRHNRVVAGSCRNTAFDSKARRLTTEPCPERTQESGGIRRDARPSIPVDKRRYTMHFRVLDLAAERCVWSVPPIDMVPLKLRWEKLVVRSFDVDANLLKVEPIDGIQFESVIARLFADRRTARLRIHLATDESYAGRVERFDIKEVNDVARNDNA